MLEEQQSEDQGQNQDLVFRMKRQCIAQSEAIGETLELIVQGRLVRFQPDHFFPCKALPISAIARRTPLQGPQAHRRHCEMAANSARKFFRCFFPTTFRSSRRPIIVSKALSTKGDLRDLQTIGKPKPVSTQLAERVHIHTCETLSLRSIVMAPNGFKATS